MQWLMLQQETPEDFVIATGKQYSVRDFVNLAAGELGIKIRWEGEGAEEKGYNESNEQLIVAVDPKYFRPAEVETLLGDPSKAKEKLGWEPETSLAELVKEMVAHDLDHAEKERLMKNSGFTVNERIE
jgi:GDPmannose 4,6-dehydratase